MHYLHIFNVCNVTNIHKNKTTTYHTKDYAIKLKEIRPFPDTLYRLTITAKTEQPSILDNITTPAGSNVFICDCVIGKETENDLLLYGYVADNLYYKIVITKEFSF